MKTRRIRQGVAALAFTTIASASSGVLLPGAVLAAPPGAADFPAVDGQWGPVENWPMVAIHAALDARGRVVTYGTDAGGRQTGQFIYDIWDPSGSAGLNHNTLANTTQTDLFCSLQLNRPDTGDMLLFGGDNWIGDRTNNLGNPDINSLDVDTGQLTAMPGMNRARWYGTGTVRADGSMFIQGGAGGADHPELWTAEGGSQLLDHLDTSELNWWYPRNFLLPDGRIFGVDILGRMYYISADLSEITMAGRLGTDRWGDSTTAVMFAPGQILHFGGPTNTAVVIDANGVTPTVTPAAAPHAAREWVNSTLLPDGRVLATGGASYYTAAQADGRPLSQYNITNAAEIWNPATGQWEIETNGVEARLYHSTALLLPDGRVLVAGGGAPGPVTNTNAEIFSPDYLYSAQGGPVARPTITAVSATDLNPGGQVAIAVGGGIDIGRVTLLKTGSVTHSINMEQRISDLAFTVDANGTLTATLPASGNQISPGYYLLSVLTTAGVPSESVMVRVLPQANAAPVILDAEAGQVSRLYQAYFLRQPDAGGFQYWRQQLASGAVSLIDISNAFAASAEFTATYGALTDAQFVDQVYLNVMGRPADPGGHAYWTGQLAAGVSRGEVMVGFSESAEFVLRSQTGYTPPAAPAPAPPAPPAQPAPTDPGPAAPADGPYAAEVRRLYRAYFLREPDADGLAYWTGQRAAGVSLIQVSEAFAGSAEFIATYGATTDGQFVDLVYGNVLERAAEPEGRAYWIGQLAAGTPRGEVMTGFSESDEFILKVAALP
ncbi:MAG: DUF4214 domain-containing protein [Actinomycetota bacterium]